LPDDDATRNRVALARQVFDHVALSDDFVEFLTLPAYQHLE
jgi:hypothetical protein